MKQTRRALLQALVLGAAGSRASTARCSRPVVVPLAPVGILARLEHERPAGVAPELLRQIERQGGGPFKVSIVPRGQMIRMFFETHESDVLFPAVRNMVRDHLARFVPMLLTRPALLTLPSLPEPPRSIPALLDAKDLQGVVVRSYTYGHAYDELIQTLAAERRLTQVRDVTTVLRMLLAQRVQFSLLPPSLGWAEQQTLGVELRDSPLRYSRLEGLPHVELGVYISRVSKLSERDQLLLQQQFQHAAGSGLLSRVVGASVPPLVLEEDLSFLGG